MDLSIFSAFQNAIVYRVWEIGSFQHGTIVGNTFVKIDDIDVIVDEGTSSIISTTPETTKSDFLIYAKPEQLPTLSTASLVGGYMLHNSEEDKFYEIIDAGIGKNQETGRIEHVELKVVQTGILPTDE